MRIRPERTFEQFSRGLELVQSIHRMWEKNDRLPRDTWPRTLQTNQAILKGIDAIRVEFDLTVEEWHYWGRHARGVIS